MYKVRQNYSFNLSILISVHSRHSVWNQYGGTFTAREHNTGCTSQSQQKSPDIVSPELQQKEDIPRPQRLHSARRDFQWSEPPIVPLSRTSVWLASRNSFARCSRVECSSESLLCKDLYKFILELARTIRPKRTFGSRQQRQDRRRS